MLRNLPVLGRTPVARGHRPLVPLVRLHSSVTVSCFALIICVDVPALPRICRSSRHSGFALAQVVALSAAPKGMGEVTLSRLELLSSRVFPSSGLTTHHHHDAVLLPIQSPLTRFIRTSPILNQRSAQCLHSRLQPRAQRISSQRCGPANDATHCGSPRCTQAYTLVATRDPPKERESILL